jgi:hypothetical protein
VLKRWKDFDDSPRSFEPGCNFGSVDPSWFTVEKGCDMQRAEASDASQENKKEDADLMLVLLSFAWCRPNGHLKKDSEDSPKKDS